jgi:hypothetical protein
LLAVLKNILNYTTNAFKLAEFTLNRNKTFFAFLVFLISFFTPVRKLYCQTTYAMKTLVSGGISPPLTSALDGGEWSASSLGLFTPREGAHGTLWIGAGLDAVENNKNLLLPSPSPQPVTIPDLKISCAEDTDGYVHGRFGTDVESSGSVTRELDLRERGCED